MDMFEFTSLHPDSYGQKFSLRDKNGQIIFLSGFANPFFYFSIQHVPSLVGKLEDDQLEQVFSYLFHPTNMDLVVVPRNIELEGDLLEGACHPSVSKLAEELSQTKKLSTGKRIRYGYKTYVASKEMRTLLDVETNTVYPWEVIKDTFLVATNKELQEWMVEEEESLEPESNQIPENVAKAASQYSSQVFEEGVYPLVKSTFPVPGSVVTSLDDQENPFFAVVTPREIMFFDSEGARSSIHLFGENQSSIALLDDNTGFSSPIVEFAENHCAIDLMDYSEFVPSDEQ